MTDDKPEIRIRIDSDGLDIGTADLEFDRLAVAAPDGETIDIYATRKDNPEVQVTIGGLTPDRAFGLRDRLDAAVLSLATKSEDANEYEYPVFEANDEGDDD